MNQGFIVVFNDRDSMMISPRKNIDTNDDMYRFYILIDGNLHAGGMITDPELESPTQIGMYIRNRIKEIQGRDIFEALAEDD